MGECEHCGYKTKLENVWDPERQEALILCVVCVGANLHMSASSLAPGVGKLFNAMIDAHGVAYREAVETALHGGGPAEGSYETYDG